MSKTHEELMAEIMPYYEQAPERFKRFWDAIFILIIDLPEWGTIEMKEHCKPQSIELFKKIAAVLMMEYNHKKSVMEDYYDFTPDEQSIRHYCGIRNNRFRAPLKWMDSAKLQLCKDSKSQ